MIVAEALLIVVVEKAGFTIRKLLVYLTNNTITAKEKIIDVSTTVDVAELHPSVSQTVQLSLSFKNNKSNFNNINIFKNWNISILFLDNLYL